MLLLLARRSRLFRGRVESATDRIMAEASVPLFACDLFEFLVVQLQERRYDGRLSFNVFVDCTRLVARALAIKCNSIALSGGRKM